MERPPSPAVLPWRASAGRHSPPGKASQFSPAPSQPQFPRPAHSAVLCPSARTEMSSRTASRVIRSPGCPVRFLDRGGPKVLTFFRVVVAATLLLLLHFSEYAAVSRRGGRSGGLSCIHGAEASPYSAQRSLALRFTNLSLKEAVMVSMGRCLDICRSSIY